jgi:hypothetical protein
MLPLTRYALIAVASVLITTVSFLVFKYRKLHGRKEAEMDKEDVIGRLFIRKLGKIEERVGQQDPGDVFIKLSKTMRSFFSELFDIRYQFDYLELNEELGKKGVKEDIRKDVISLTMQMSQAEYGGQKVTNIALYPLLEKAAEVVNKVTGHEPEPAGRKPPAGAPAEGKPAVPAEKAEEAPQVRKAEEALELELKVPRDDQTRIDKMRRLLLEAEQEVRSGDYESAMDSYTGLKEIYDSLTPKVKAGLYDEIRRIIEIYNSLLKEYKDTLLGKEQK